MKGGIGKRAAIAVALFVFMGVASAAPAAPMPADLQTRLMALYNRWSASLGAGKLADAASISVPELQKQIADAMKTKEDADGLAAMAKEMAPDSVVPTHGSLSKDGKHATIITLASKKIPDTVKQEAGGPKPGSVAQAEITLKFALEGDDWKFAEQVFGMDPNEVKRCHDATSEKLSDYDEGRSQSAGGMIQRVEFKPDHTLLVFRVVDEENCAVLPSKDALAKSGADLNVLAPYTLIEFSGYPHKTDKQRVWVRDWHALPDE